jgi:aminoglycoside phosphotransferase (APT) family kinase protein
MNAQHALPAGPIDDVEPLSGGTQNTMLQFSRGGQRYVLRCPPPHKRARSDETIRRETRVLGALASTAVPHPRLVAWCADVAVLGSAFYLTEFVAGANPTLGLPAPYLGSSRWRRGLGLAMADGAAAVGAVDYVAVGLGDLGKSDGYLERQVPRWRAQLASYSELDGYPGLTASGLDTIGTWLETRRPRSWRPGLIHGDYHLANVLCSLDRPGLAAIVDWELATIGDPLVDLGWLLATWPPPEGPSPSSVGVDPWDGFPSAAELVDRYAGQSDRDLSAIGWYTVLACYKMGIILEGTWARALSGQAPMEVGERLHARALGLFEKAHAAIASTA